MRRQFVYRVSIENAGFFPAAPSKNFSPIGLGAGPLPRQAVRRAEGGLCRALFGVLWIKGGPAGEEKRAIWQKEGGFFVQFGNPEKPPCGRRGDAV